MATFESDFRFSRPPNEHASSSLHAESREDEDNDDEPIFGDVTFSSDHAGPSDWRRRYHPSFDDSREGTNATNYNNGSYDTAYEDSFQVEPGSDENSELYACLNIDKDASSQDILRSYRALAVAFHPDKHKDEQLKAAAETGFQRIQHAYEGMLHHAQFRFKKTAPDISNECSICTYIRSDPQKRAVYDLLGQEGLKTEWRVGQKLKSPEELRAEYEKVRLKRAQADIENLVRSRTEATISLDASRVVNPNSSLVQALPSIRNADVRQLFMKASTLSVISPTTQITYTGSMLARRGAGGGNLLTTVKHQYSPKLSLEAGTTLLHPRMVTAKVSCQAGKESFINVETSIRGVSTPPPVSIVLGTKVTKTSTGFVKFSTGTSYSFLALFPSFTNISFFQPRNGTVSNFTLGASARNYSINITTDQFLDGQVSVDCANIKPFGRRQHGWTLSTSFGVSFTGATSVNINTDKKLTENTSFGLGVGASLLGSGALTMRLRISRLGQRLTLPIILSTQASARLVISTVLLPGISIASLQYFYLTPRRRKRIALRLQELREEAREDNQAKRKEALAAAELLTEQVARKREYELKNDGLVILDARYRGAGQHVSPQEIKDTELDVTVALQALVVSSRTENQLSSVSHSSSARSSSNSSLTIPGGRSKASLIGFCDVLVGSRKELAVQYLFGGRRHSVVYDDRSPVAIPMRSHLVE